MRKLALYLSAAKYEDHWVKNPKKLSKPKKPLKPYKPTWPAKPPKPVRTVNPPSWKPKPAVPMEQIKPLDLKERRISRPAIKPKKPRELFEPKMPELDYREPKIKKVKPIETTKEPVE